MNINDLRKIQEDIKQLCHGARLELINGKFYIIPKPNRMHQFLSMNISARIFNHIEKNKGKCHIYTAPLGVRLFADDETWVEPDILVICKRKEILSEQGCDGAPDLIVEIVSPSNSFHDYVTKLMKYQQAGVREYWIVDPMKETIGVYNFETETVEHYNFTDKVKAEIYEDLEIDFSEIE